MKCPFCRIPLEPGELEPGIEHYLCNSCMGRWFPRATLFDVTDVDEDDLELEEAIQGEIEPLEIEERQELLDAFHNRKVRETEHKCPKCQLLLMEKEFAIHSGVLIYKCPEHHGIWVKLGDLEKIRDYRLHRYKAIHDKYERLEERERRDKWIYNPFFSLARLVFGIGPEGIYDPSTKLSESSATQE